ncbi:MAG: hypothetical protein ACYDH0_07215 [Candidatus Aminicenantales bacterium]
MSSRDRRSVTRELVRLRLKRSPVLPVAASALAAFVVFGWVRESYETALKSLLLFLPHLFLMISQDMAGDEIRGGTLENVLFLGGGFRDYLFGKNPVLAAAGTACAVAMFAPLWAFGVISQRSGWDALAAFAVSLLAGFYYIGLGGLLSRFLAGGSNVLVIIVAQASVVGWMLFSAMEKNGLVDILETGTIRGIGAQLKFLAAGAVLPNIFIISALRRRFFWVALFLAAVLAMQRIALRRLEVKKP